MSQRYHESAAVGSRASPKTCLVGKETEITNRTTSHYNLLCTVLPLTIKPKLLT